MAWDAIVEKLGMPPFIITKSQSCAHFADGNIESQLKFHN